MTFLILLLALAILTTLFFIIFKLREIYQIIHDIAYPFLTDKQAEAEIDWLLERGAKKAGRTKAPSLQFDSRQGVRSRKGLDKSASTKKPTKKERR